MYTATKEHPALFNAAMVRALREGRKTQTRRIVKGAPTNPEAYLLGVYDGVWGIHADVEKDDGVWRGRCPYGVPGDRLWVRETWMPLWDAGDGWTCLAPSGREKHPAIIKYRADGEKPDGFAGQWKPSIHMPRWASRITLEITGVRVERVQGITGADARAEGCKPDWDAFHEATCNMEGWEEPEEFIEECEEECDWVNYGRSLVVSSEHREFERDREYYATKLAFRNLWGSIHGPDSWRSNPFVWACEFRRVK